jgi:hypothetical protein
MRIEFVLDTEPHRRPIHAGTSGHEVGSNLCGFLFGYGIRRILFTGLKDVFQSAAIFRCGSVSKQFDRQRRKGGTARRGLVLWRGNAYNAESFGFILTANFTFACHSVDWPLKECMHKKQRILSEFAFSVPFLVFLAGLLNPDLDAVISMYHR